MTSIQWSALRQQDLDIHNQEEGGGGGGERGRKWINYDEFYAERVASFEKERNLFDHYIRLIQPEHNEAHDLEWESRNLLEEARLAEQAGSNIDMKLQTVQEDIAATRKLIEEAEYAQKLRKEQIQRLILLARPVDRDTTYIYKDLFPSHPSRQLSYSSPTAIAASRPVSGKISSPTTAMTSAAKQSKAAAQAHQEEANKLFCTIKTGEVIKLELKLQEETVKCSAYLRDLRSALKIVDEDRHRNREEHSVVREEDMNKAMKMWREVDRNESQCFHAVSELLRLRYRILSAQRQEVEELEKLQQEKNEFIKREEETKKELIEEMAAMQRSAQRELQEVQKTFQQQIIDLDGRIAHWKGKEAHLIELRDRVEKKELKLHTKIRTAKERLDHHHSHSLPPTSSSNTIRSSFLFLLDILH
eukprot:scaffold428_cov168-Ochromonas_danica.AAC.26